MDQEEKEKLQELRNQDLDRIEKWFRLSERMDEVLEMYQKISNRQLAKTFKLWYLRLIKERRDLGLNTDEAWALIKSRR